jgi:GntR family transcriptional repressor for pyruvate dehydrogenase complex
LQSQAAIGHRIIVTLVATSTVKQQLRPPRLAEMVSGVLRDRILSGELEDGSMLPKQEELLEEFGVSMPPIREALRILETEGLITVKRGNVGGAVVHRPQPGKAAYMLGLVLQSRAVTLGEVVKALLAFEPACAAACASRPDRDTTVLPRLRATLDAANAALDDAPTYTGLARQFHVDMVATCGNEPMMLVVGALEALWTAHVDTLARRRSQLGSFAEPAARKVSAKDHERLYGCIARGDARAAEQAARDHYSHPQDPGWGDAVKMDRLIEASFLQNP